MAVFYTKRILITGHREMIRSLTNRKETKIYMEYRKKRGEGEVERIKICYMHVLTPMVYVNITYSKHGLYFIKLKKD